MQFTLGSCGFSNITSLPRWCSVNESDLTNGKVTLTAISRETRQYRGWRMEIKMNMSLYGTPLGEVAWRRR